MWKIHYAVLSNILTVLTVLARPQDIQIEKQVMLEIPFDEFKNGKLSTHNPLFNVVNNHFHSDIDKDYYKQSKFNRYKNSFNYLKHFNDDFSVKSDNRVMPNFVPDQNIMLSRQPAAQHRSDDERVTNDLIENLSPPSKFAPITSYAKPIKAILEDQLRIILAEYRNLPKSNPSTFENALEYEENLKADNELRHELLPPFKNGVKKDFLEQSNTNIKERNQKALKNKATEIVNPEMFSPSNIDRPEDILERIILKKGGIAIVGPKGIATAERGGTAIVGPNGVAYTKPNGVAIVGPGSRIVSLPTNTDLNKLVYELYKRQSKHPEKLTAEGVDGQFVLNNDGNNIKEVFLPIGGKIVATGPAIYHDVAEPENSVLSR